jgi:Mn-containing catalase
MKDMLSFLIARDTMPKYQWMDVLEELGVQRLFILFLKVFRRATKTRMSVIVLFRPTSIKTLTPREDGQQKVSIDRKGTFENAKSLCNIPTPGTNDKDAHA